MATRQSASKPARGRTTAAGKAGTGSKAGAGKAGAGKAGAGKAGAGKAQAPGEPAMPSGAGRVAAAVAAAVRAAARWAGGGLPLATLVVSVLGLADAIYLTYQHFAEATSFAGCSDKGAINCVAVTTSAWSYLPPHTAPGQFGIPVSILGLAFFAFMVVVNTGWGWRAPWAAVHWARFASVIVGIVFVLYLVWAELFRINAICLYCTGVHALTFVLFALIVAKAALSGVTPRPARR